MIRFDAMPTETAAALWSGGPDAYGLAPERRTSDGAGVPCRHCLRQVQVGRDYLVLAYRPFAALHAYAETGPVFLCAEPCPRGAPGAALPAILASPAYILRGYDGAERIVYGTGGVVATADIPDHAAAILAQPGVVHVDVRSAANNCFQVRIRGGGDVRLSLARSPAAA
jgi:hypothetical protein